MVDVDNKTNTSSINTTISKKCVKGSDGEIDSVSPRPESIIVHEEATNNNDGEVDDDEIFILRSTLVNEYHYGGCCFKYCSLQSRTLLYCCIASALGGSLFGWDIAAAFGDEWDYYFGIRCPETEPDCALRYKDGEEGGLDEQELDFLLVGTACIAEIIGSAIVAPITFNKFGRKPTMIAGGFFYLIGSIMQASSITVPMFFIFRFVSTFGLGILNMICPLYISELAPIHCRGQLTSIWYLGGTIGLVAASIFNIFVFGHEQGWRMLYIGDGLIAIVFIFVCLRFIPESHFFLLIKNRKQDAKNVLKQIRPKNYEAGIELELKDIEKEIIYMKEQRRCHLIGRPLLYGILIQFFNEFSGVRAFGFYIYFLVFQVYGGRIAALAAVGIYLTNLIGSTAAFITIERVGRPMMMFTGGFVIFVILLMCLSVDLTIGINGHPSTSDAGFFLLFFVLYEIGFSYSWGPVSWIYCTEIFGLGSRGIGVGISTAAHSIAAAIVRVYFINYGFLYPKPSEFLTFVGCSFCSSIFAYFFVPETSNKTTAEVRKEFKKHKVKICRMDWGPD